MTTNRSEIKGFDKLEAHKDSDFFRVLKGKRLKKPDAVHFSFDDDYQIFDEAKERVKELLDSGKWDVVRIVPFDRAWEFDFERE